ncbi:VOC family protein [Novosphingobium mathurense]|uniref:Glyoxalase/Bleomycin resistance protein/Dioxygenase superfamily protein n=1 Tax=Novosphingobium mathurense TaxID=428990 RepID=A0A1U6H1Z2_9SPHN|nr:VOC family protein [Novosphingobium mathurense]SLJ89777.1 Glyoxalase/Bleomycin resistance protein/Dioxygenase superfamily protein [Novosphingobium mathurense]
MGIELNHTIVWSSDKDRSAQFVAEILGLPEPGSFGRFRVLELGNGVSLDFADRQGPIAPQHYAFLVSDDEFDAIFARIKDRGIRFWADPGQQQPGQINHRFGGRGVYFEGPDGHDLEALTAPYSGAEA